MGESDNMVSESVQMKLYRKPCWPVGLCYSYVGLVAFCSWFPAKIPLNQPSDAGHIGHPQLCWVGPRPLTSHQVPSAPESCGQCCWNDGTSTSTSIPSSSTKLKLPATDSLSLSLDAYRLI